MERDQPAPTWLTSAVRRSILMAGNAENLAVGQGVRATLINRHLMVRFPTTGSIVHTAGVPIQYLTAAPRTMSTAASSAFASSARALPCYEDGSVRKSHILLSFPQRKLTKLSYDGIITVRVSAPSKPLVLLQPSSVPADGGFCLCDYSISQKIYCRNALMCR